MWYTCHLRDRIEKGQGPLLWDHALSEELAHYVYDFWGEKLPESLVDLDGEPPKPGDEFGWSESSALLARSMVRGLKRALKSWGMFLFPKKELR